MPIHQLSAERSGIPAETGKNVAKIASLSALLGM